MTRERELRGKGKSPKQRQDQPDYGQTALFVISAVVTALIERFGWPGTFLILGFYFVEKNASEAQKEEIIQQYILGDGISNAYALILVIVVAVVLLLLQSLAHRKRVRTLESENERLANWKSGRQSKLLHPSDGR